MGRYTESHEGGRAFIGDGMEVKRLADIPMSATWLEGPGQPSTYHDADVRESASVAHIYGQNLVAAESLTVYRNAWMFSPETLKSTADRMMTNGLNRFVIHTSVHQPVDDKIPGLGLGPFGQWFNRHETWAEMALPWTTYLSRSSFMLQQGRFVADILYYYGEDSNITALFGGKLPDVPAGYGYDFVNADALLNRLSVKDGRIVTPSGMSYRLLALDPNSRHMSLAVLKKIRELVKAGAAVAGPKPIESPSLADDQAEFGAIADELWDGVAHEGRVIGRLTIAQAMAMIGASPDFTYTKPREDTSLAFVHRLLPEGDIYWVVNGNSRRETVEASFRVTGKEPELWHAETGSVEPAPYLIANGRTIVPLRLAPDDAVFVVFRKAAAAPARALPDPVGIGAPDGRRPLGGRLPTRPRRPGLGPVRRAELLERERRSGDQVFLRNGDLYVGLRRPRALVRLRDPVLDRPGQRQEPGRGQGQRPTAGHRLEDALPRRRDRGPEARPQHARDQGGQPVGQPPHRRQAAGRDQDLHVHGGRVLQGRFGPASLRTPRPGQDRRGEIAALRLIGRPFDGLGSGVLYPALGPRRGA